MASTFRSGVTFSRKERGLKSRVLNNKKAKACCHYHRHICWKKSYVWSLVRLVLLARRLDLQDQELLHEEFEEENMQQIVVRRGWKCWKRTLAYSITGLSRMVLMKFSFERQDFSETDVRSVYFFETAFTFLFILIHAENMPIKCLALACLISKCILSPILAARGLFIAISDQNGQTFHLRKRNSIACSALSFLRWCLSQCLS